MGTEIRLQKNYLQNERIETLYFGGGTPSLLSSDEINRVVDQLHEHYDLNGLKEFTLEANPDDLSTPKLQTLRNTAINRFSIGIQSFFNEDLKYMNRSHDANQAESAIKAAQDKGFENITIDLIYGTPTLPNHHWQENLEKILQFKINHFSAYSLTVENKTPLEGRIKSGKSLKPLDSVAANQFELLCDFAEINNIEQYEISNFCLEKHYSLHNSNYWKGNVYLGLGPSSHSYDGNSRQWNVANNVRYVNELQQGKIPAIIEELSERDRFNEYVMTSLRTAWGMDMEHIRKKYGVHYFEHVSRELPKFIDAGKLIQTKNVVSLTRKGKFLSDGISSDLFMTNDEGKH